MVVKSDEDCEGDESERETEREEPGARVGEGSVAH